VKDLTFPKVGKACGTCSICGKTICKDRPTDVAYCDCHLYCPLCGERMTAYTPDLGKAYNPEKGLSVLYWCNNPDEHEEPYYSSQMPVEVELE